MNFNMECLKFHIFSFLALTCLFRGLYGVTVTTPPSLTAVIGDNPVELTCSYTIDTGDILNDYAINWQLEKTTGGFENIATYSPPNGRDPLFTSLPAGVEYRSRSNLTNPTTGSLTATLKINTVKCTDEKKFRCLISFTNPNTGASTKASETTLTVKALAEEPYEVPVPSSNNIEENMQVQFSCTANVGKPPGQIKWWRYRQGIIAPDLLQTSNQKPTVTPGICEYNITSTLTQNITKDDDQSVFRCTVDNELITTTPVSDRPNQETQRINVYYAVRTPTVTKDPDFSELSVGSEVIMTCTANGNPKPNGPNVDKNLNKYVWMFKADASDNATEIASTGGNVTLANLQINDTGMYYCIAHNYFNSKSYNATSQSQLLTIVKTTTSTTTTTQSSTSGNPTGAPQGTTTAEGLTDGAKAGIGIGVAVVVILIVVLVICIIKRRKGKDESIDEPPEKPRNNRPDIVNSDKNSPFYTQVEKPKPYNNSTDLQYADLTFDNRPGSRKPVQFQDNNGYSNNSPYSEVMMPSV